MRSQRLFPTPAVSRAQHIALGALVLATKVEEGPRKMRDVLQVFMHLEQKRKGLTPMPTDVYSNRYTSYRERLVKAEREILKELGFILYTEHPHKVCRSGCGPWPRAPHLAATVNARTQCSWACPTALPRALLLAPCVPPPRDRCDCAGPRHGSSS